LSIALLMQIAEVMGLSFLIELSTELQ
jgi:hypothetical protein